jgi:hypothetical protein
MVALGGRVLAMLVLLGRQTAVPVEQAAPESLHGDGPEGQEEQH